MKRRAIIAGNWKMNYDLAQSEAFAVALRERLAHVREVDVVLCPPFIALASVAERLRELDDLRTLRWVRKTCTGPTRAPIRAKFRRTC